MSPIGTEAKAHLAHHHAALADTVFDRAGRRIILLRANVGLGKSVALAALAGRLLQTNNSARVLFVVPRILGEQFEETLRQAGVRSVMVDRYRFREMLETASNGETWPRGAVVVVSPNFAEQPDILESLTQTKWDLVIADEAHRLQGTKAAVLRRVGATAERVVLAGPQLPELERSDPFLGEDATVIEWRWDRFVNHRRSLPDGTLRPLLHEVPFTLTPPEIDLQNTVIHLCNLLRGKADAVSLIADSIVSGLGSSPAALENTLRKLVDRSSDRGVYADALGIVDEEAFEDRASLPIRLNLSPDVVSIAEKAIIRIEHVSIDSKLNSFGTLLDKALLRAAEPRRIFILTEYLATLFYLDADIEGRGLDGLVLHGGMNIDDRQRSLDSFAQSDRVLVATAPAMQGVELGGVTDVVLYDVPSGKFPCNQFCLD